MVLLRIKMWFSWMVLIAVVAQGFALNKKEISFCSVNDSSEIFDNGWGRYGCGHLSSESKSIFKYLREQRRIYGRIFRIRMFHLAAVNISHPDDVEVNLRSIGRKRFAHLSESLDEIHVDANVPWGEDTLFTLEFRADEGGKYALHTCNNKYLSAGGKDQATEVILTLGEAFEVAYQMALREQSNRTRVTQSLAKTPTHDPMTTTNKEKPNMNHGRSHSITEIKLNGHQLKIAPIPASLSNEDFQATSRNSDGAKSPRTPLLKAPIASTEEL